jgi:hypothetical protein
MPTSLAKLENAALQIEGESMTMADSTKVVSSLVLLIGFVS